MIDQFTPIDYSHPHLRDCELLLKALPTLRSDYFYDLSPHHRNGTLTNMDPATDWVPSHRGMVLDLDGSNDYVDCGNEPPGIAGLSECTFMAWVEVSVLAAGTNAICGQRGAETGATNCSSLLDVTNGALRLQLINNAKTANRFWSTDTSAVPASGWVHVAASWFGGATTKLVVNGVDMAVDTYLTNGTPPNTIYPSTRPFMVGASQNGAGLAYQVNGQIDDVRVYSRALTAEEIRDIYLDTVGMRYSWIPRVGVGLPVMSYYQSPTAFVPQIIWYN